MLCKDIIVRSCHRTFESKPYCTYHSYQLLQTCNNQQIWMYSILSNSQVRNWRSTVCCIFPKRISHVFICDLTTSYQSRRRGLFSIDTIREWLPQSQESTSKDTKKQDSSYWVGSALMRLNFSRRNILEHNNKQEQNSKCPYIHQQLEQYKIFKSQQYQ